MRWSAAIALVMPVVMNMAAAEQIEPRPYAVAARLPDALEVLSPSRVRLDGWIGARIAANANRRLLEVDTDPLLAGFKKKPGTHPWIGEHIGKWLHAATLAWAYTGDHTLRAKLDRAVAELVEAQEADGYLGTYLAGERFGLYRGADWDVWSHKYNLIGLLTYHQYTGDVKSLGACRKMADLLIRTFPARKSLIAAGTHVGMAATSVLEPIVQLYRTTGDERYLDFARYIVRAYDEEDGPKILATLRATGRVDRTANAKAYEMLSNLVGVCELARATGEASLLVPVKSAWEDVAANRLYLTGGASSREHFQDDHVLPNAMGANVGETCVTTTWIQLNLQLLRLTGEAKYGDELERTIYNHLTAAQHPRGDDWCYYTSLEGTKPYDDGINCCHSSGPRGMALVPQTAYLARRGDGGDALVVSTFESSTARMTLGGVEVTVEQEGAFPVEGKSELVFRMPKPARFGLLMRAPQWARPVTLDQGAGSPSETDSSGWVALPAQDWEDGEKVVVSYRLPSRLVLGQHGNAGKAALVYGPFVLAFDRKQNPELPSPPGIGLLEKNPPFALKAAQPLAFSGHVVGRGGGGRQATFVPFADAGADGGAYRVWLWAPGVKAAAESLLFEGREERSRQGNLDGAINDGDPGSMVVTFDGRSATEDWYAVMLDEPAKLARVIFRHGRTFHDGGWFDASTGKPRVEVKRTERGDWEPVGSLEAYPATTATDPMALEQGQAFELVLKGPVAAYGVRVIGVPACGDNIGQAFSSCAELIALER